MGCDGGTIPKRDELVRTKKKPEQKDKDAEREFRWLHCALTQERLQEPIVMCALGRLYSKQNIIEQLLEKDKMPDTIKHIKSMRDIKELQLTANPAYTPQDKDECLLDARHAPYICKLIGLEMSGKFRFVALWSCGCVMSERALKQIGSNANACPLCQTNYSVEDVIVLNGNAEDLELMQAKLEMRQAKRKAEKKGKKEQLKQQQVESSSCSISSNQPAATAKSKLTIQPKRLHVATACANSLEDPEIKRLKSSDFSVAKDPKATDVYKSLFTTHKSEQQQTRAHWVTYNPFYN